MARIIELEFIVKWVFKSDFAKAGAIKATKPTTKTSFINIIMLKADFNRITKPGTTASFKESFSTS